MYPITFWNDSRTEYFCEQHIQQAKTYDAEEKKRFWNYYRSAERREWLSDKQKALLEKIDEEIRGRK